MLKVFLKLFFLLFVVLFMSSCAYKKNEAYKKRGASFNHLGNQTEYERVHDIKDGMNIASFKDEKITIQNSLEATISSLATQMMTNKKLDTNKPVIITSFVRLDQLKTTSEFGRILGESLIDELSNRGFNVIEFRGKMAVSINDKGEYFLSRKPHEIKKDVPSTYIVVGTYSRQAGRVILNARFIDNITGKVISSARATYIHGLAYDCVLFNDCPPLRTIKVVKEK